MNNGEKIISNLVSHIQCSAMILAFEMDAKDISPAFDLVNEICLFLNRPKNSEIDIILETKRRTHEKKITCLCQRDAGLEVIEELRKEMKRLGYTAIDPVTEAAFDHELYTELYFARYYARNDLPNRARSILDGLKPKLDEYRLKNPEFFKSCQQMCKRVFEKENNKGTRKSYGNESEILKKIDLFLASIVSSAPQISNSKLASALDAAQKFCLLLFSSNEKEEELKLKIAEIKSKLTS